MDDVPRQRGNFPEANIAKSSGDPRLQKNPDTIRIVVIIHCHQIRPEMDPAGDAVLAVQVFQEMKMQIAEVVDVLVDEMNSRVVTMAWIDLLEAVDHQSGELVMSLAAANIVTQQIPADRKTPNHMTGVHVEADLIPCQ